jgi:hypothetical protein
MIKLSVRSSKWAPSPCYVVPISAEAGSTSTRMPVSVNAQTVHPRKLAAVRREVAPGAVGRRPCACLSGLELQPAAGIQGHFKNAGDL